MPQKVSRVFYDQVYNIFKKHAFGHQKKSSPPTRPEETVLELFALLPANCKDEELEDIIYFILDAYQLSGHQVFLSDIAIPDVSKTVVVG